MKKINSIDYGGKVIGLGLIFLLLIPTGLYLVNCIVNLSVIKLIQDIFFAIGVLIELAFLCILLIELRQDKIINNYYEQNPASTKTPQQILDEDKHR